MSSPPPTTASQPSRKRKRPPAAAPSPAPSDTPNAPTNDSLATRSDLASRPILTISRSPLFVPCNEGPSPEYFKTDFVGINRVGFRYVPAGINPPGHATPCRTIESSPTSYRISWEDRSPFIKVSKDGLGLAGSSGFRSARCNAPMREGQWYLEVKIIHGGGECVQLNGSSEEGLNGASATGPAGTAAPTKVNKEGAHVRLGWGRREASLNGPVGVDGYSYGYRDKTGDKVTLSRPRSYGKPFGSGDVIGMYISLPPRRVANPKDSHDPAHLRRERIPIDLKGQEVFEILEYPQSKEMAALIDYADKATQSSSVPSNSGKKSGPSTGKPPETAPGGSSTKSHNQHLRPLPTLGEDSKIAFFVNGECQGVAFQDLYDYLQLRQPKDKTQKAREKRRVKEGVKEHRENPFDDGWLGYYPFISLFNDACVRINPGPDFEYPPPPDIDALLRGRDSLVPTSNPDPDPSHVSGLNGEDMDVDTKPQRRWRPACERYPEFMQEQWEMDKEEEEETRIIMSRLAESSRKEEERAEQRRRKRREAEARRRAAKKVVETEKGEVLGLSEGREEERNGTIPSQLLAPPAGAGIGIVGLTGPGAAGYMVSGYPSPSPLRYSTAACDLDREFEAAAVESERGGVARGVESSAADSHDGERGLKDTLLGGPIQKEEEEAEEEIEVEAEMEAGMETEQGHSPAPTAASYVGLGGSEYASDFQEDEEQEAEAQAEGEEVEGEGEGEVEEEEGEVEEELRRVKSRVDVQYMREEDEEDEEEQ